MIFVSNVIYKNVFIMDKHQIQCKHNMTHKQLGYEIFICAIPRKWKGLITEGKTQNTKWYEFYDPRVCIISSIKGFLKYE